MIASACSDKDPAWYRNLVANPLARVEIDGVDRPMTASNEKKEQIWHGVITTAKNFAGYQVKTSRNIPVVVLEPRQV